MLLGVGGKIFNHVAVEILELKKILNKKMFIKFLNFLKFHKTVKSKPYQQKRQSPRGVFAAEEPWKLSDKILDWLNISTMEISALASSSAPFSLQDLENCVVAQTSSRQCSSQSKYASPCQISQEVAE